MLAWTWPTRPLALLALLASLIGWGCAPTPPSTQAAPESVFFCFWNVENLFDDRDDRRGVADEVYDSWFAQNPDILHMKLRHLAAALVKLNGGRGPDILALVEVESMRAAELLRDQLNQLLPDETLRYPHVLMKEVKVGRHIAPVLISRVPVIADRTRQYGSNLRILETHLRAHGQDLVVVAAHWTSRLSDKSGKDRARYADQIYGRFHAMYQANPGVDWLLASDCNDSPTDPSIVRHLHATGDRQAVQQAVPPALLNLMADKPAKTFGTIYYRGWKIYDSIFVSPGMLDSQGWSCETASIHTVNGLYRPSDRGRKPWAFGTAQTKGDRGTSDHFPVCVQLTVKP